MNRLLLATAVLATVLAAAIPASAGTPGPATPADITPDVLTAATHRPDLPGTRALRAPLRKVRIARFNSPVEVKSAPGFPNLLFVVEQPGRVMVVRKGRKLARPFLNIRSKVAYGGEQGLLSVAFPPNYKRSGRFYVYFTARRTGDIRVVEYRRGSPVRARHGTARSVIRINHRANSNHNGGQLQFLGRHLYFGTGDGGGGGDPAGNAQNRRSLLGKLIRIDPRPKRGRPYTVPKSNPFVGRAGRNQIFSIGLRNPYRWSFDRTSSRKRVRIAIGDVGQDAFEEINYVNLGRARGGNFGWSRWEGFRPYSGGGRGTIKPSVALPHPPNCSVIGGLVVRDRSLPILRGRYVFTDFCNNHLLSFKPRLGRVKARRHALRISSVTSFGESLKGALYVTSLDGSLYRIRQ